MRVAVLSDAAVPIAPSSISTRAVLAIGTGAGVLVGALAVAAGMGGSPERSRGPAPAGDAAAWRPTSAGARSPRPSPRPAAPGGQTAPTAPTPPRVPSPRPGPGVGPVSRPDSLRSPGRPRAVHHPCLHAVVDGRDLRGTVDPSHERRLRPDDGEHDEARPGPAEHDPADRRPTEATASLDAVNGEQEDAASSARDEPDGPDAEGKDRPRGDA